MAKMTKQAESICTTTAGQMVRDLQALGLSLREIESRTGVDKSQLSRVARGLTTGEEPFRKLVRYAIEMGVFD